jgi:hypothetical protein
MGSDSNLIFWKLGEPKPLANSKLEKIPFVSDFNWPYLAIGCNDHTVAIVNFENFF